MITNKYFLLLGQSFLIVGLLVWINTIFSPITNTSEKTWIKNTVINLSKSYERLNQDIKYQTHLLEKEMASRPEDKPILDAAKAVSQSRNAILDTILMLSNQEMIDKIQKWKDEQLTELKKIQKYNRIIADREIEEIQVIVNDFFSQNTASTAFDKAILKHQFLMANYCYTYYYSSKVIGGGIYCGWSAYDCVVVTQSSFPVGKSTTFEFCFFAFCQKSETTSKILGLKLNSESTPMKYTKRTTIEKEIKAEKDLTFDLEMQIERKHYTIDEVIIDTLNLHQTYHY